MTLQIEFTWLVGLLVTFFGAAAGMGKLLLGQHQKHNDSKFAELDRNSQSLQRNLLKRLDVIENSQREESVRVQRLEHDFLKFQSELPVNYVRREDYIRGQATIEAKLDSLATKLENWQLRTLTAAPTQRSDNK